MYSHFIHRALGTLCGMAMVEQKQNNASKNVPANVKKQKHTLMHLEWRPLSEPSRKAGLWNGAQRSAMHYENSARIAFCSFCCYAAVFCSTTFHFTTSAFGEVKCCRNVYQYLPTEKPSPFAPPCLAHGPVFNARWNASVPESSTSVVAVQWKRLVVWNWLVAENGNGVK